MFICVPSKSSLGPPMPCTPHCGALGREKLADLETVSVLEPNPSLCVICLIWKMRGLTRCPLRSLHTLRFWAVHWINIVIEGHIPRPELPAPCPLSSHQSFPTPPCYTPFPYYKAHPPGRESCADPTPKWKLSFLIRRKTPQFFQTSAQLS